MGKAKEKTDWRHLPTSNESKGIAAAKKELPRSKILKEIKKAAPGKETEKLSNRLSRPVATNNFAPYQHHARPLIILGDDNRQPVNETDGPYKCICLLKIFDDNENAYQGTGFLVSPKCIITAGHNVFFLGKWAARIVVTPAAGDSGNAEPFGSVESRLFKSVGGWTAQGDENFDYGAIILQDNSLSGRVGSCMEYEEDHGENEVTISGYPKDKARTQWLANGSIEQRTKYKFYYNVDTVQGNSGSPVFLTGSSKVIGVHTNGDARNHGVRLSPGSIERWREWSSL